MVFLIVSIVIAISLFSIGLLARNNRSNSSSARAFSLVCMVIAAWVTVNQLGINEIISIEAREILTYLDYALGSLMVATFVNFSLSLKESTRRLRYVVIASGGVLSLLVASGIMMDVVIKSDNQLTNVTSFGYYIYLGYIVFGFVYGVSVLIRTLLSAKDARRRQLELVVWSLTLASVVAIIVNIVLPAIFTQSDLLNVWASATYGSVLVFAAMSGYALFKRGIFDLRSTAARSVGYLLTFGLIAALYSIAVFGGLGSTEFFKDITVNQRLVIIIFALLSAVSYQPLKGLFDKITNRLFFRDTYDTQNFIDELNKNLVSGVQLDELLTKSALIIQDNLKSTFVTFYIRQTSYFEERIIGARRNDPEFTNLSIIQETARNLDTKVYQPEPDPTNDNNKRLSQVLRDNDVELMVRLVNTLEYHLNGIGYIFIGPKLSGNAYSKRDFKVLEIVANELVIAIENALRFEEIEEFNVTLQKKIDEATKELRKSNEKLTALDEAKDEFISMASHQLRTPLTSVKGYLSMVLEGDAGKINEQQAKLLDQAFISSQRMVYLIADLLNVSRLKTGKFAIEAHPTNLADVVEEEIRQLKGAAEARNLKLEYEKPKEFPRLMLDETKIRQVIMNFVDNAIYYTPSGTITVYLKTTKTSIEFGVTDTGMGVPKKDVPQLFSKFYRAGNARKARPDGTGLGLFMAKKVIVASGGSILFKTKEGKGSTFGFIFPLKKLEVPSKK